MKNWILALKQGRPGHADAVAKRILETSTEVSSWLTGAILVPAPRSAPLVGDRPLWPPFLIARALVQAGIAHDVEALLERVTEVSPSHRVEGRERPGPREHRESVEVRRALPIGFGGRLVIVDDIITRGSTLLGCAQALQLAYPEAEIVAFAVARTKKEADQEAAQRRPAIGLIRLRPGSSWIEREP